MQKPTRGSVKASQARPTNRMMEAENGSTWNGEQAPQPSLVGKNMHSLPTSARSLQPVLPPGLKYLHLPC